MAQRTGCELHGDGSCVVESIETLQDARAGQITFLNNPQYRKHLADTQASAVILRADDLETCPTNALISRNPYLTYAQVAALFAPPVAQPVGVHASAWVHEGAKVSASASIGPGAAVGEGSVIGERVVIGPNCVIGNDVTIGADTRLVASVNLMDRVRIGQRCLLHPGAVVGSDGFGLANDAGVWVKIAQLGSVIIEDDVEIGANTTIDRGAIHDTVIHKGAKLDNQIQIAHNVEIGEHTAIAACTGISGSTKIGAHCMLAGGVGVVGHIEIADGVVVSGASVVSHSLREPGVYTGGVLAMPHKQWAKNVARVRHLDEMARKLKELEKKVAELSQDQGEAEKNT